MVLTELDVFKKCVASKTTMTKLAGEILRIKDVKSKQTSKIMLKLYYKVWSGLTKFLRSQCSQQRCVYFSLLGSFCSISHFEGSRNPSHEQVYLYIPDAKFLDRGGFKNIDDDYNKGPYSDTKMHKVNVSPSSIAHVCDTNTEAVTFILKDIINKSINLSKEAISIRLGLKIGHVNISKHKVFFESLSSSFNDYSSNGMNRLIGRRMHKSFGNGTKYASMSMKTSVRTPGSAQSIYSGMSRRIHASNPNPQAGETIHPKFNKTMYDTFVGQDPAALSVKRDNSAKPFQKLPFPFVSGMVGGHSYTKPGKKVFFTKRPDNKDVLTHQLQQISYNKLKKRNDYENARSQDNDLLRSIKFNMNREELKKRQMNDVFKTQYKAVNDNQRIDQEKLRKLKLESKYHDKYNFFPYTHGDEIEKKRIEQKELLTQELRDKYSQEYSESATNRRDIHSVLYRRSPEGKLKVDTHKLNQSFTNDLYSPRNNGSESSQFGVMKSYNGKVPVKFLTGYPAFLTPSKHYPYRRLNDTHVESVMQSAVKRYEEGLKVKEKEKVDDAKLFKKQLEDNNSYYGKYFIKII